VRRRKRPHLRLLAVLLVPLAIFGFVEVGLRAGIALGVKFLRNPDLYADWTADDDFWKLRQRWGKNVLVESAALFDPFIGWTLPKTPTNPLGAVTNKIYIPNYAHPAVLFVGDSFVEGVTPFEDRIPQSLEAQLKTPVYNLGMSGYGLDQIYLRLQQAAFPFKYPAAIVGMATVDLDRSIMGFRTGPKPYFSVEENRLVLRGVPMPKDPRRWLKKYPPEIGSYAARLLSRQLRLIHGGNPLEVVYLRDEKKRVNAKILEQLAEESSARRMPLYFVLFYNKPELEYEGWRERFLKDELNLRKIPYLDTKPLLLSQSESHKLPISNYYAADGHLSAEGNRVVAAALAERLRQDHSAQPFLN
jgi:hypothetical protein